MCFAFLVYGCAPAETIRRRPVDVSETTPVEIVEKNNRNLAHLKYIKALTTLNLESPKSANQFTAQMAIKLPDSVYVKIEGVLGIDGLKASFNRETFVVYNIVNKYVVYGATGAEAIRKTFDYDLTFDEMVEVLIGWPVLRRSDLDRLLDFSAEETYFVLHVREDYGTRRMWVDPFAGYAVSKIVRYDSTGQVVMEKDFTRFEKIGDVYLPRYVRILRPREKDLLSIYFDTRTLNRSFSSRLFTIDYPKDLQPIHLE